MSLSNFGKHREEEIINKPYENLKSIDVSDDSFYFSHKGSDQNGNYEWEKISDPSFQIVSIDQLREDTEFMEKLKSACEKFEVEFKTEEEQFKVTLRNLYDETAGFDLPFTLLDADAFNKELLYHNAKEQIKTQSRDI